VTVKGTASELVGRAAASGPWRTTAENMICMLGHKYPMSRIVSSLCRHFAAGMIKREGDGFERVATFASGGKMYCTHGGQLGQYSLMYYFTGTITGQTEDERPIVKLLINSLRAGDVVFDVGANFGFYSLFAGPLCGLSGAVHAFEANPVLGEHLRRSIEHNRSHANIFLNELAVGAEANKTLELYGFERIGCSSLYRHEWLDVTRSIPVPVTTIDHYRRTHRVDRIDVMKIDIEGAELDAFHGMAETFAICPPGLIICELMPLLNKYGELLTDNLQRGSTATPVEIANFLSEKGYVAHFIRAGDGRLGAVVEHRILEELSENVINVCFVHHTVRKSRPALFAGTS
jgi:FkbM family methyltransferase